LTATEGKHQHTATLSLGTWYWRVRALPDGPWTRAWRVLVADPLVRVTTDSDGDFDPSIIQASDGTLWAVWWAWRGFGPDLWYSTSSDGGATWASHTQLTASPGFDTHAAIAQAADGRVWVVWTSDRTGTPQLWHKTSNDGGLSWSPDSQFTTDAGRNYSSAMARTADGRLWVVWISDRAGNGDVWYKTSSDNGATWSPELQLTTEAGWDDAPAITQDADGNVWVVWSSGRAGNQDIWFKTTSDSGSTWSAESQLTTSTDHEYYPTLDRANDGTLWLMWNRYIYSDYSGSQLWYKTSSDNGATWSKEKQWTRFMGQDYLADLAALQDGSVAVAWCSDRAVNWEIWFGVFGQREDVNPPPHVQKTHHRPGPNPDSDDTVTIRAFVADEAAVVSVHALWTCDGTPQADLALYDDGAHNDDSAGDGWYGGQIGPFPVGTQVSYQVRAVDSDGNSFTAPEPRWAPSFTVLELFAKKSDILFVADDGSYSGTAWFRDYYTQAFDDGGWAYDLWSVHWRGAPDATVLNQYADGAVVWASPAWNGCVRVGDIYCSRSSTLDALRSYLDNGGRLFLSSQDLGVSLQWETFLPEYLYAEFVNENSGLHQLKGTAGDPIGDGLALGITGGDGANNQNSPDEINPIPPAVAVLSYDQGALAPVRELESALPSASGLPTGQPQWGNETNPLIRFAASVPSFLGGAGHPLTPCADCALRQQAQRASTDTAGVMPPGTAAVRVDTGTYKVVYFAFGFEGINARTDRAVVMDRVLRWLGVPPPARLEFSPSAQTVRACSGRLTMDVELQESPALGGFELVVTYDPQIVHVEGFSLGSFLHSTTRVFTPLPAQIDNSAGTAALGAFSFGAEPAPSGSGPIATITFTVVNTGTAALSMEQVQLTRPDAKLIRTVTKGGSITVLPALFADVDCDCDVDVVDIMLVASRWRARLGDANYDPRYDLDGDDDIDIVDIMLVASHWSETCGDSTGTSRASRQTTAARPDAARARATDVQITARQAESKPGDVFTVDVAVNNARDLGGFECTLTFDPQALQVEKVELGSFLASTGRSVAALGPEMDNKKGSVHLGAFTYGQKFGPDGRGILARVTVRSLQAGGGRLAISHLQLVDTAGHLAPMGPLRDE
ncbi:MAG: hypothetical protein FJ026_09510, partial [Chloroflexi bacterium]|nr:hypothetical protein [Chloroflexota bacterium]